MAGCTPPIVGRSTESALFSVRIRVLPAENLKIGGIFEVPSPKDLATRQGIYECSAFALCGAESLDANCRRVTSA
jgi:hypothetical protein